MGSEVIIVGYSFGFDRGNICSKRVLVWCDAGPFRIGFLSWAVVLFVCPLVVLEVSSIVLVFLILNIHTYT